MTSVVAADCDLTWPSDDADTLSISCERGAFLVSPLLFSVCLGENKNYLLQAAWCLWRAVLGNALVEVSQRRPRGGGETGSLAPGAAWGTGWEMLMLLANVLAQESRCPLPLAPCPARGGGRPSRLLAEAT